jgi:SAM-dependent methyltransferase
VTATTPAVEPDLIVRMATADCRAKVLHSAVELDVFSTLADDARDAEELLAMLGLHPRLGRDFLDALVALGLLDHDDDGYRNSTLARRYLDRSSDTYLGTFVRLSDATLYATWDHLSTALRTGEAQTRDPDKGGFVGDRHSDGERVRSFLRGLDAFSDLIGDELVRRIDWSRYGSVADLGGARGHLAAVIAASHPHVKALCLDMPRTEPFFDEHMRELDMVDRVRFVAADLATDPLPTADVLIYGQVLHGFGATDRANLVARAYDALPPGGLLVVYDRMINDVRDSVHELLYSLHTMLVSPHGSEYRPHECQAWLRSAGFAETWVEPLLSSHTMVVGRRAEVAP